MTRRASNFERVPFERYETPSWVLDALGEVVALRQRVIWEPACGTGKMVRALMERGAFVHATDIVDHGAVEQEALFDFTSDEPAPVRAFHGIITNPPFGPRNKTAEVFIERGLARLPAGGFLVLLLPIDFDSAKTRARFFGDCPHFAGKVVLTKRIQWFEDDRGGSNTQNYAFFIWRRDPLGHRSPPSIWYAPRSER